MIIELLLLLIIPGLLLYRWITKSFDKWEKLGLVHDKPTFPYGTHNILANKTHLNEFCLEDYKKFKIEQKQKVHGWFLLGKPTLSINDVDLLKQIQVKDFNHFVDRNEVNFAKQFTKGGDLDKLWGSSMDNAMGDHWKDVRSTFSPIFTSGKMRGMFAFIKYTSDLLTNELGEKAKAGEEFNLKDTFGKFSLDTLASCAFGVDAQSFTNEKSVFVKYAAEIFAQGVLDNLAFFIKLIPGWNFFAEMFNVNIFKPTPTRYFRNVILNTLKARKASGEKRNDLVDMMLECLKEIKEPSEKNSKDDKSEHDDDQKLVHQRNSSVISEDEIVATALVFLVAGYDTTGMTLSYWAYAMSKHPEIQEKLQAEVDEAFEASNGEFPDYSTIQNLPYTEMVLHETLRRYNVVGLNTRSCTEDYSLPGTDITLRKGDLLSFSLIGIHTDPEYYSHPEEFYPEHFSKEEKAARNPYAFQAFGQGPRACIGMRFALLEAKAAMVAVARRFSFQPGTKTIEPLELDPESALGFCKGGVWANIVERDI